MGAEGPHLRRTQGASARHGSVIEIADFGRLNGRGRIEGSERNGHDGEVSCESWIQVQIDDPAPAAQDGHQIIVWSTDRRMRDVATRAAAVLRC